MDCVTDLNLRNRKILRLQLEYILSNVIIITGTVEGKVVQSWCFLMGIQTDLVIAVGLSSGVGGH